MTTLLSPAEARARLHMGENQLYALIKRREIAVVQRGRKFLIPESTVRAILMMAVDLTKGDGK